MTTERCVLLKNVRLIDPTLKKTEATDLLIGKSKEGGRILRIGKGIKAPTGDGTKILNAHGRLAGPAFTDLRCALPDAKTEYRETMEGTLSSAAAGGFAHLLFRPGKTLPDSLQRAEGIQRTAARFSDCRVFFAPPVTVGGKGERLCPFEALKEKGARAICADAEEKELTGRLFLRALEESRRLSMLFIAPCAEKSLSGSGVNEGRISKRMQEQGEDGVAELLALSRAILLAHRANTPVHFPLVSLKQSVEMIRRAKREGIPISCATAPPYFSLTEDELLFTGNNARLFPALRSEEDRIALIEGLQEGVIDCICTDHTPLSPSEKESARLPGAVGLETAFGAGITHLVLPGHLSLYRLLELMSIAPARLLGMDASLKEGAPCNLVFLDTESELVYSKNTLRSHCSNTPFFGKALRGRVSELFADGHRQI